MNTQAAQNKMNRLILLPAILGSALASLIALTDRSARADTAVSVEPIRITRLGAHAGKFVHAFYVSGREAAVGISGQRLQLHAILAGPVRIQVPRTGIVELPSTRVPRNGFMAFNYLYLAVTDERPNPLFLRNLDGTRVRDPRASPEELARKPDHAFETLSSAFVSAKAISRMRPSAGGSVEIDGGAILLPSAAPRAR
jgi:hypothetical protein